MKNGTFYSLGATYLSHYGRKGMKWGKNIFENALTKASVVGKKPATSLPSIRPTQTAPATSLPSVRTATSAPSSSLKPVRPGNAAAYKSALRYNFEMKKRGQNPASDAFRRGKLLENNQRSMATRLNFYDSLRSDYDKAQKTMYNMINNVQNGLPTSKMPQDQKDLYEAWKSAVDHPPALKDGNPTSEVAALDAEADRILSGDIDVKEYRCTPFEAFYLHRKYGISIPKRNLSNNTDTWPRR